MARDEFALLRRRSREWLEAAAASFEARRLDVAFEEARTAAELAGKALLFHAMGTYPQKQTIAGDLHQRGPIPESVDPRTLSRLLQSYTRSVYLDETVLPEDVSAVIRMAEAFKGAVDEAARERATHD